MRHWLVLNITNHLNENEVKRSNFLIVKPLE